MARIIDSDFLHRALQHFYGYSSFRTGQEEIISEILHGQPVLAVLPTGAGKSICFQLPSLLLKGVTLVISPLISLMKDQAEALTARGIPAAYLDSSMSSNEYGRVLHAALNKQCKFLYVAPERLVNQQFIDFARQAYITMVQEEIISEILHGQPVLAVLPTGAGKSICFQLPSLLLKGVTLVISPLISLMKDQAEALTARGIPAAYLDSSMSSNEYGRVLHAALNKQCKFLYVAPERLVNQQFIDFARQAYITMVAVDEAHCVSQWGHSFRKEYYNIPDFIQALPAKPLVAAFTATATPDVRRDIIKRLGIPEAKIVVTGFDRPNLHFAVQRTQDKERSLLEFMRKHKKDCGVVYCATRNKVESVTQLLRRQGFSALRYHAGLTPEERRENQNAFVGGSVPLIVATNAFGMGIDKPDVRFVVHYNMPKDIESYYQEAGRAGRDGLPAECLLLYDKADIAVNTYLIGHDQPDLTWKEHELQLLSKMTNYCNTSMCLRKVLLEYFGEKTTSQCNNCGNCDVNKNASWRKFLKF